jgi:hypothetical protein
LARKLPHRLSPTPVFLGFPFHRWRGGVLALDPVRRVAGPVARVLPLRHDALKAHLASVREHERAVLLVEVLIEARPGRRASEQAGKRRLAHRERITPHVLTIELDQVEGVEGHAPIVPSIADVVEARDPVLAARHRLAVDDAGARAQLGERPRR